VIAAEMDAIGGQRIAAPALHPPGARRVARTA